MKKEKCLIFASFSCPARNSTYFNHVLALLYEIADYFFNSLKSVPTEIAYTSKIRQWGQPGKKSCRKA